MSGVAHPESAHTATGEGRLVLLSLPSCPDVPSPQHFTLVSCRSAHACDEPIDGFVALARHDALLGPLLRQAPGLRPLRTGTIAHAAVQAFAGQLITFREAQQIERRILRLAVPSAPGELVPSPTAEQLLALGTARIVACGLAQRRARDRG